MSTRIRWTTELVAAEMLKENCILKSEYINSYNKLEYEYNGKIYSVLWMNWIDKKHPVRSHLCDRKNQSKHHIKWDDEKVKELLAKEDCELISDYHSIKQRLKYRYNNLIYFVTLNNWYYNGNRPHLTMALSEIAFHKFINDCEVEFEMQKSFSNLRSKNNGIPKFDFYLPEYNTLIEIDGVEHYTTRNKRTLESDQLKEEYCIKNKIKLFRFDTKAAFDDYLKIFDDPIDDSIFVYKNW